MKRLLNKPFSWAILFSIILIGTSTLVLLDTFVIPKSYTKAVVNNNAVLSSNSKTVVSSSSNNETSETNPKPTTIAETPNPTDKKASASVTPIQEKKKSKKVTKKKGSSKAKKSFGKGNTASVAKAVNTKASIKDNQSEKRENRKSSNKSMKTNTSAKSGETKKSSQNISSEVITEDNYYKDSNIEIKFETLRQFNTTVHIADVKISDISYLKAAFANDTYGRNIKLATSDIAECHNAIFAVNGDFYGFRDYGYVLRNGTLYRDATGDSQDLIINNKGDFICIDERETSVSSLDLNSIWQIFSFGPVLINDGELKVDKSSEVVQSMRSNPRTAIGMIAPLHYLFVVSDGRTREERGLSLYELATIMKNEGCSVAYNLDGGGSSTMYFNGNIINNPTDGYNHSQRKVSDIVYIGDQ